MIERYFLSGILFKWTKPEEARGRMDGSIIDDPRQQATPFVYDGLNSEMYRRCAPHVWPFHSLHNTAIPYSWLSYAPGNTVRLYAGGDILTGFMSGCLVTVWTDQARRYVGHVGTVGSDAAKTLRVKETFVEAMPQNTIGFDAHAAWSGPEMMALMRGPAPQILALVTQANEFYSIVLFPVWPKWWVGGIKRVTPMNYEALRLKLIR